MTSPRSIVTVALGVVFGGAMVGYAFFQPHRPDAVRDAMPAAASFVLVADDLDDLLASPVRSQLDKALGAGNTLKSVVQDNDWVGLAASAEIAVADIPFRSVGENKSWAAASWVGWRSPWLRWKLEAAEGDQLEFIGKHLVWPIWKINAPDIARGMIVTCALTDNLFIVCLSESPADIKLLLDTYDRRAPARPKGYLP